MKYFEQGDTENGYGPKGIVLDRVFSMCINTGGNVVFTEECDGYFTVQLTPPEAIKCLQEAIDWINKQSNKESSS